MTERDSLNQIEDLRHRMRSMRLEILAEIDADTLMPIAANCFWKALSFLELAGHELEAASLWIVEKRSRDRS